MWHRAELSLSPSTTLRCFIVNYSEGVIRVSVSVLFVKHPSPPTASLRADPDREEVPAAFHSDSAGKSVSRRHKLPLKAAFSTRILN